MVPNVTKVYIKQNDEINKSFFLSNFFRMQPLFAVSIISSIVYSQLSLVYYTKLRCYSIKSKFMWKKSVWMDKK